MQKKIAKLYAAYRSGCLGDNIFHVYFLFLARIILEEKWDIVDEAQVAEKFKSKYDIPLPLNFVRQILSVGIKKSVIVMDHGIYIAQKEKLKEIAIFNSDFDSRWSSMLDGFRQFCVENNFDLSHFDIEACVLKFFDVYDENILSSDDLYVIEESDLFDYTWHSYLKMLSNENTELFDFIVSISASNIMKEAVFYSSESADHSDGYTGLCVYLDSPMVFALLGMDSPARIDSCKLLVSAMQRVGCRVLILDHNFAEIKGIMQRASGWATSPEYNIQKANNVAKYFHDVLIEVLAIAEFCESAESKLNCQGVTIKNTEYDITEHSFQEDEVLLYSMIETRYAQDGRFISEERKKSIQTDVRSIIMVYRERRGQVSTKIQTSNHIMITLNGAIANVSKKYESNKSIDAGHIPACVSADLFGAILWLFTPEIKLEYQRKQLLADCYIVLRPSKKMLEKYMDSLECARNADEIDEKQFLFMRAHTAVNDALMNVTKGDYSRFNDQTYREVYDEIEATANKRYEDEAQAHGETKERLTQFEQKNAGMDNEIENLRARLDARDEDDFNRKCSFWGWVISLAAIGGPYIIVITVIELTKGKYSSPGSSSLLNVFLLVVATVIAGGAFTKGKTLCFKNVRKYLSVKRHQ